jgi:hypothetical protein
MNRFTPDELRRAILALDVIEERGDRDEWAYILRQAHDSAPSADLWGNATGNQRIGGSLLADRLARLLGERRDDCEQAAAEVFAPQRCSAAYDALIRYADELTAGQSVPRAASAPAARRPSTIRIVADERGVA